MFKMDKMYVNLRYLWGLSWYFIIQGLDQLRDRRLWLVSFVLNYVYIGKISPKYYHNLKWVNKLKGALWRALGLYSSALFETTSSLGFPFFLLLSLHLSPPPLGNGKEALDSTLSSKGSLTHPQTTPLQKLTCSSFPSKAILRLKAWSSNNLSILLATDVNRYEWSIQHTSDQF